MATALHLHDTINTDIHKITGTIESEARNIVLKYSAISGLLQLLPVPFLDSLLVSQTHERMNIALFEHYGLMLEEEGQDILREKPRRLAKSLLTSAVMFPIKKVLKKVIFIFTLKGVVDVSSSTFHDGWLASRAIEGEYVELEKLLANDEETISALRDAILKTKSETDTRPMEHGLKRAWRSSFDGVKYAYNMLTTAVGNRDKVDATTMPVDDIVVNLHAHTSENPGYFLKLDQTFYDAIQAQD